MMFCMPRFGDRFFPSTVVGSRSLLLYKFIQFLLHSGITNVARVGGKRRFACFLLRRGSCLVPDGGVVEKEFAGWRRREAFTRLTFAGNFSTINVSAERGMENTKTAVNAFYEASGA